MRRDNEDRIDPRQPALIVLYGNTKRKHRPLDQDVIVLGRASGCDLGLVSPEVAPVHCVIVRLSRGWRIRDCSGRPGTCVNGRSIHDEPLGDGDVIQVGSFSFQAHLPGPRNVSERDGAAAVSPSELVQVRRMQRSRRNLAGHALRLRRQVRELVAAQTDLQRWQADLEQQEARVRTFAREQEERARLSPRPAAPPAAPPAPVPVELDRRREELACYAAHLRRWAERLQGQQEERPAGGPSHQELVEQMRQRDQQVEELLALIEQTRRAEEEERAAIEAELQQSRLELERERALLAEERATLERLRAAARPESTPGPTDEGVSNKLALVRKLRQELAERRQVVVGKGPRSRQLRRVQVEQNTPAPTEERG